MEVIVAAHAGFCFGVKRAVEMLSGEVDKAEGAHSSILTWGPIIHNDDVVASFAARGVETVESLEELEGREPGTVIIRAHGVPKQITEALTDRGFNVVDATCPYVKHIHEIVSSESAKGRKILVIGDPAHPEVQGIVSFAADDNGVRVIGSPEEAQALDLPPGEAVTVVAQTTFRVNKFQEIVAIIRGKEYDINVVDTVCRATQERQKEAEELSRSVDAMIVVGGAHSSNTRKLYEICSGLCPHTSFVHSPKDMHPDIPENARRIGITAGASTPQKIIEEVAGYVRTGQEFH